MTLSCADDDNQGQSLEVFWEYELDRRIITDEGWDRLGSEGFDPPDHFAAFVHTLRWNCVTATDPHLFQAPFRAGIKIDAYQMEPLRKALKLPRVNLFIADDTGLGKTIEAGLIARELLLRRKVKNIVVAAPPSVLEQWKAEMEERFGLIFEILDRAYLSRMRRERGFGVNPWRTHSRFLISHALLIDPTYTDPMREWLGTLQPGSLLILDEAHHAAPSRGGKYQIESKFTRAIRDLAGRFEHRLFLSATPHNGHSNSFSTLLELLDPYRFTRGVKVRGKKTLEDVMVRRLKEDIRSVQGGFPERKVVRVTIDDLPEDAPELVLSRLLDEYRNTREERFASTSKKTQASAALLVVGLQQRLLSSIDAFARTLKVHRETVLRRWKESRDEPPQEDHPVLETDLLVGAPGPDDERSEWPDEAIQADEEAQFEAVTEVTETDSLASDPSRELFEKEQQLLDRMEEVAEASRHEPDARVRALIDWIRNNLCPGLPQFGHSAEEGTDWNDRRVLIFTESVDTKRYLHRMLERAITGTAHADRRIALIDGQVSGPDRKEIQRRFNADPEREPLRVLIATDAAREGLNFQAQCTDLFHFDLPWNPARIEQRNGRIDRKLQPAETVRCHYFVLPQRVEDRVLEVLVRKTETIKEELGSLSKVIDADIERRMGQGIRHRDVDSLAAEIEGASLDPEKRQVVEEEFEAARERQDELKDQIEQCRTLLQKSREWTGYADRAFREALSCSLEILGAEPLRKNEEEDGRTTWAFPPLDERAETDPSWAGTLDTLRAPRGRKQKLTEWRNEAPIRPVVFEDVGILTDDVVHLHLEQRVAQRLLARFRAQGFIYHDLSRACLVQSEDSIPRVVLLGRLSLYGAGAERLHEEIVPLTARWVEPDRRDEPLSAYARETEQKTLRLLDNTLTQRSVGVPSETVQKQLLSSAPQDIEELLPQLEPRGEELAAVASERLKARGEREASDLEGVLTRQRDRVESELRRHEKQFDQLTLGFPDEERRQLRLDMRSWSTRLEEFDRALATEPDRIRDFYKVRAKRIEPVGLVYLWPESN